MKHTHVYKVVEGASTVNGVVLVCDCGDVIIVTPRLVEKADQKDG